MSRTKRLLALVVTALMVVSMLTVITFAAGEPVFSRDYVDPNGVIKNTAYLVDGNIGAMKTGDTFVYTWDGQAYQFTVGVNAFAKINDAIEMAGMSSTGGKTQILLGSGNFGELRITEAIDIFGVNWNTNPNVVNPENPESPWTYNPEWTSRSTDVTNIVVEAVANGEINIYGVKVTNRIYDMYRPVSSVKTALTLKNVVMEQDDSVVGDYYQNTSTGRTTAMSMYAVSLWNLNAHNSAESGKRNVDETYFVNFRLQKLAGTCNRFMDEYVSPKVTFDGCYFDVNASGFTSQGFWMKWRDYMTGCSATVKNSCYVNSRSSAVFTFESYNKNPVGKFDGQHSELNIVGNLLYNAAVERPVFEAMIDGFSEIHMDGNTIINESVSALENFVWFPSAYISNADYSDRITMRNNTVIGLSTFAFGYGNDVSKVDTTGTYFKSQYIPDWKNETSDELPSGKVRYDYCYKDAARTMKTSDVPLFTVNGVSANRENRTIEISAPANTLSIVPEVSGLAQYDIYESNADFTNEADYSRSNKVTECTLKNQKNYFLLIAYSYDLNTTVVYKLTVNKAETAVDPGELVSTSSDAVIVRNALEYNVSLDRDTDSFSFKFANPVTLAEDVVNVSENADVTAADEGYNVTNIQPNDKVVLRFHIGDTEQEYFYVNIIRGLSAKCDILSVSGVSMNGTELSAFVPGDVSKFVFGIEIPEGATASVWQGTSVYPMNENGEFELSNLKSGINTFSLGVTAENGVDYKLYTLTLDKEKSTEALVYSVAGAVAEGDGFTATARSSFKVDPVISAGATFKVYADAACTQLIENNTVAVTGDTVVYIIVTSESGTNVSAPVALTIKKSDEGIVISGEVVDQNDATLRTVRVADNEKSAKLNIEAKNVTYKLYADKKLTTEATADVQLDQGTTFLYAQVRYSDGETELVTIKIVSARTSISYKDNAKIPNWAKTYIDKLNASGTGVLQGDSEGNFNAANSMTRYEVAAIAVRLLGIDATQYAGVKLEYTDTIAKWAENYVKAVTKLGIMGGSNNSEGQLVFDGKSSTTRSQLAKIIVELSFFDNEMSQSVNDYYTANKDAVDSYYNSFDFADEASVQNWAKTYVKLAVYAKYFNGSKVDGRNYISGKDNIKRSEIAAVCTRYLGL